MNNDIKKDECNSSTMTPEEADEIKINITHILTLIQAVYESGLEINKIQQEFSEQEVKAVESFYKALQDAFRKKSIILQFVQCSDSSDKESKE